MPLSVPKHLPAFELLKRENIFLTDGSRAHSRQGDPLRIVILNLMPEKETTEADLLRVLSCSPLPMDVSFMSLLSHTPKHTAAEHIRMFYKDSETLMRQTFDGMIVTGAPVETIPYEAVDYWAELRRILDWARLRVRSTLYLCWGAMAALYHFYGIDKHLLPKKRFGVYRSLPLMPQMPIFRGFDDYFYMPHSRHTDVLLDDVGRVDGLQALATSPEAGLCIAFSPEGRSFFSLGHLEYPAGTLNREYHRDFGKRTDVGVPQHYYLDDDPSKGVRVRWRSAANLFYGNWIHYYVCP